MKKPFFYRFLSMATVATLIISSPIYSYADYLDEAEQRKELTVQSNEIENWPEGPKIGAESAILMDATTGAILYEKNIHEKMYPASTTKLMTCLLCMEKEGVSLNDMVYFSHEAVDPVTLDASNIGINVGDMMSVEECLYGILVCSANEVSNAIAEYVSGDIPSFVNLMNERAKELGCLDTHFNNPHGYTDPDHYTSAYDLALICKEFSKNELLCKMSRTPNYHWYPTDTQPDDMQLGSNNYFLKGYYDCDGLVCTKTGYTDESRSCLVTCAERNGMKLIAVIMKEETPYQYEDTLALLDYGFDNFDLVNVSENETKYTVSDDNFFDTNFDILGNSSNIIFLDSAAQIIVPKTARFDELSSELNYDESDSSSFASIVYSYNGAYLGSASLLFEEKEETSFVFDEDLPENESTEDNTIIIYINYVIYAAIGLVVLVIIIASVRRIIINNHVIERNRAKTRWKKRKRGPRFR